jgi:hypothetical protein
VAGYGSGISCHCLPFTNSLPGRTACRPGEAERLMFLNPVGLLSELPNGPQDRVRSMLRRDKVASLASGCACNLAVVTDHRIGNAVLNDGFCSHELINLEDQSRVTANDIWPAEAVQRVLDESQT